MAICDENKFGLQVPERHLHLEIFSLRVDISGYLMGIARTRLAGDAARNLEIVLKSAPAISMYYAVVVAVLMQKMY